MNSTQSCIQLPVVVKFWNNNKCDISYAKNYGPTDCTVWEGEVLLS